MKIRVQNSTGRQKILNVNNNDKISKAKIDAGLTGFIWKFNAEVLQDDKTFEDYGIEDDDVILYCAPSPGGSLINK